MIKKALCICLLVLSVMMTAAGCTAAQNTDGTDTAIQTERAADELKLTVKEISKHGNVILDTTFDVLKRYGIEIGDIITVTAGNKKFDVPVGTAYTDVDSGDMICRFDTEDNETALAINYGSFAEAAGIAEKQTTEEAPGYIWTVHVNEIGISLKEKKGYLDEYNARNLTRTDVREDYPDLSGEEFANFRAVSVSGLKENLIYRSSTPLDNAIGRDGYAMAATEKAGVKSIINLGDSADAMKNYPTYGGSCYSRCAIVNPEMGYDFESEEFAAKVRECVVFIIENDGPYLIHCKEGKDRTGIVCAVLECFAGATADDVRRDYMITYYNYYGVKRDDAVYSIILNNNLIKTLNSLLDIESIDTADLKESAERYFASIGITNGQLDALGKKLVKE